MLISFSIENNFEISSHLNQTGQNQLIISGKAKGKEEPSALLVATKIIAATVKISVETPRRIKNKSVL